MRKTVSSLDEFLSLDYELKIAPYEEDGERGHVLTSPEINGLNVFGETIEEAIGEMREAKIALFELNETLGTPIPYPLLPYKDEEGEEGVNG